MRASDDSSQNRAMHSQLSAPLQQNRREFLLGAATAGAAACLQHAAWAQGAAPVRLAIAYPDIPRLWGGPDGGFQGFRTAGYTIYDALINWDLESADRPARLTPGLAESWNVDPSNPARWIFRLRQGVKFHDGSDFNADAALWNFASIFDEKAPHYHAARVGLIRARLFSITGAEKIDDRTIAVNTRGPEAMAPYQLSFLLMASPAHYANLGNNWDKYAVNPSGTGPFRFGNLVPRTRLELVRNDAYWDTKRIPKAPSISVLPILDGNARVASLRSGQVDMVESVPPDAIASLNAAGFPVRTNVYPAVLVWALSILPDSPFRDVRVRKAANLAVDREGLVKLLNGAAVAAKGFVTDDSPWFARGSFALRHDPNEARKLLAEAGYGPSNRVKTKILVSSGGGGQVQPLQTAEFVQANLAAVGIDVEFQVVDFVTLFTMFRNGARAPVNAGIHGVALPAPTQDPTSTFLRGFASDLVPPRGSNWGFYSNPQVDEALKAAQAAFDPAALDRAIARINQILIDDMPYIVLVHDLNPWAISGRVKNFVLPRNWFINLTSMSVD
jgi:ABC-type transport system substrate-binding protein